MTFRREVIGPCELLLGDCRELLPTLGRVDAVVTDPPWGIGWDADTTRFSGGADKRVRGKRNKPIQLDDQPFDPSKLIGYSEAIIFGFNHFSQRLPAGAALVWIKKEVSAFGSFLSDCELAWKKTGRGVYAFHRPWGNLASAAESGDCETHPTQKPVALMEWCIDFVKGNVILDPFLGSGTTGVAAVKRGRKFIGIEIEERWFNVAVRRISAAVSQPDLFISPPAPKPVQEELPL